MLGGGFDLWLGDNIVIFSMVKQAHPLFSISLDFIGEIHPPSSGKNKWILKATDYFTKWIEVIPTINATDKVIINFLEENIFSTFGCPTKLIRDNAQAFKSFVMNELCEIYNVTLTHSTPYYPRGKGLEKSSNKSLIRIIKKLLAENSINTGGWSSFWPVFS